VARPERSSPPLTFASRVARMTNPPEPAAKETLRTATFAGGCFWCTEAVYSELEGVERVLPGYTGGTSPNPTYEEVCTGRTGHAEAIEVTYRPEKIGYRDLLVIFFTTHDPTTKDRQGNDVGTQYRSAVFYRTAEEKAAAESVVAELEEARVFRRPVVTEIVPFVEFFPAEEYHRQYYRRNPEKGYCQAVIAPKLAKFRKEYADRLRPAARAGQPRPAPSASSPAH
jgi:peptide-methionine (S)-S-oxide reductase